MSSRCVPCMTWERANRIRLNRLAVHSTRTVQLKLTSGSFTDPERSGATGGNPGEAEPAVFVGASMAPGWRGAYSSPAKTSLTPASIVDADLIEQALPSACLSSFCVSLRFAESVYGDTLTPDHHCVYLRRGGHGDSCFVDCVPRVRRLVEPMALELYYEMKGCEIGF